MAYHRTPLNRYQQHFTNESDPTIVNPSKIPSRRASQICGRCHSNFNPVDFDGYWSQGDQYRPGQDLEKYQETVVFDSDTHKRMVAEGRSMFWDDGTCRVGGREYLAQIESKCYEEGDISCLTCHSMHSYHDRDDQLSSIALNNDVCLKCHESFGQDIPAHTHHAAGSSGSLCYNCHMPHTTYALYKGIRSHRIDSPSAAVTAKTGRPNACNLCHLDKTLEWTAENLNRWYQQPKPDLSTDEKTIASSVLSITKGDAAQRVLMAWHFSWAPALEVSGTNWQTAHLAHMLNDPYGALRFVAYRSLTKQRGFEDFKFDFISPAEQRLKRAYDVITQWESAAEVRSRPELLIDDQGRINLEELNRLRSVRDNQPIEIPE